MRDDTLCIVTTRGRIKLLAFCLLAGAAINVAVAWGCAIWSKPDWRARDPIPDSERDLIWRTYAHFDMRWLGGHRMRSLGLLHDVNIARHTAPLMLGDGIVINADGFTPLVTRIQIGLPLLTLETGAVKDQTSGSLVPTHAFDSPWAIPNFLVDPNQWLPYKPIWPGLIINTLFYAAIVWLIVRSPIETRRRVRQWRGLCEKCAYPIGQSPVCTECGAAIKRRVKAQVSPTR